MPREKKPPEALPGWSSEVRYAISRMSARAVNTVQYHISYQQLWDAMYPADIQSIFKDYIPKFREQRGSERLKMFDNGRNEMELVTTTFRDESDTIRPMLLQPSEWAGPAMTELLTIATDIASQMRVVRKQWNAVSLVFEHLNSACRDANQMFSMWPPLRQIVEKYMPAYRLKELGEFRYVRNPPHIEAYVYEHMRETIPIVGMAMVMPDTIEENSSPVRIG